jgi:predicted nucleic acid-binding protein
VATVRVLVDTDILIDYFNTGGYSRLLEDPERRVYYSVVSRKELLRKEGLKAAERQAIQGTLRKFRLIPLGPAIAARYSVLRRQHPHLEKEDALIAATALIKHLPLLTRNWRHFQEIQGLAFYTGE